jgi:aldose 1-epimerase
MAAMPITAKGNEGRIMSVSIQSFGTTAKGQSVDRITLANNAGMSCSLITYGAAIQSLLVPDATGQLADVVLGYDGLAQYESDANPYFGATVGRHANRIGGAAFELNGKTFRLTANEGRNNLHSGPDGFNQVVWDYEIIDEGAEPVVKFTYVSPDGESGFPGNLTCHVTFQLIKASALIIDYAAVSDQDTVINLTNHAYFNLAGQGSGSILDHVLQIEADYITAIDAECLPTGEIAPVDETPFDFRQPKPIGWDIHADDEQLRFGAGYDHNFILAGDIGELFIGITVSEPISGRVMVVETTSPGVQLYTGNQMKLDTGKNGAIYHQHGGFCLETQYYPNSLAHPHFPSPVFKAGEPFRNTTIYRFCY